MKKNETIYLDQNGYMALLKSIKEIKENVRKNNMGRNAAFYDETGADVFSSEFEQIEHTDLLLKSELKKFNEMLQRVELITKHNDHDLVDIGDTIVAEVNFGEDDIEEMTFKLVGAICNPNAEIEEISVNSPFGKAIYKKRIGDNCSYTVENTCVSVSLKEKLDLSNNDTNQLTR